MGYTVIDIGQIEGSGPGGAVRFVRRQLGVEAFGVNWFELPPNTPGLEHDESGTGQEEVNIVISGGGIYRIDGEEVPVTGADGVPVRSRDGAAAGRRPGRPDDGRDRRPPRQLRAPRAVLSHRLCQLGTSGLPARR